MATHEFPKGFLWGAATSAAQIEGAVDVDGRGESIWDRYAATDGKIADGSSPAVACDHFHRWPEDIQAMRAMGLGAYRFSIAWPRVIPGGRGTVNEAGLDFYERLVDALLAAGIRPFVTLYHWDLPQALQDQGGWGARATIDAFADYADAVGRRLGDRVAQWATHNEPWCIAHLGHETGDHAPGLRDPVLAMRVAHHLLLSHGRAVRALRSHVKGEIGIVLNLSPTWPATPKRADVDAARQFDAAFNRWYLDPLFKGHYPTDGIADRLRYGHLNAPELPFIEAGDMDEIATRLDFLGVNYYGRTVLRDGPGGTPAAAQVVPDEELTDMGWEVYPRGLHDLLVRVSRDYRPARIYVTENGAAYADGPDPSGQIADRRRIAYLHGHILAMHQAIAAGVPLKGYFAWSLLDNFEWAHGYDKRFGLYWVDFETRKRLPKESAFWYRDIVAANAITDTVYNGALRRLP
jgi:beta-glucosidase